MITTQVAITEQQNAALQVIAQQSHKAEDELIREAVEQFIRQFQQYDRQTRLRQARGMWKDRTDLPQVAILRQEFDRDVAKGANG